MNTDSQSSVRRCRVILWLAVLVLVAGLGALARRAFLPRPGDAPQELPDYSVVTSIPELSPDYASALKALALAGDGYARIRLVDTASNIASLSPANADAIVRDLASEMKRTTAAIAEASAAISTMGRMRNARQAGPTLRSLARDRSVSSERRRDAVRHLAYWLAADPGGRWGRPSAAPVTTEDLDVLRQFLRSREASDREAGHDAAHALDAHTAGKVIAADVVTLVSRERDTVVLAKAAGCVGALLQRGALPMLRRLRSHPSKSVREAAAEAIAAIATPASPP
jgi:hypothetical protein